ncbi:acid phosphatase [Schizosaccharomyces cryophilus OY26]|uniref:Acid phosphatase n=1 Tax=Schizosaccharomyces cryophilus (strain OY26 / ATCC MYA-4695 / CBS 11777 / NBRC 106824 / NRRL Y48691) TaxID=653667 RepID=S9W740_SCHCR|nr:acid phosphatase [Schizosaccharomyces cryophilus OY26]EPY53700.1 acid phosphatase [Schizosaccharomyces cryophilus OY26]
MSSNYPKCVVFDLDYTLWPLWIDTHVTPPFRASKNNPQVILDRYGTDISFYKNVTDILQQLKDAQVKLCIASRTHAPKFAYQVLNLMRVPIDGELQPASKFFTNIKAFPATKIDHFEQLHKETGISYKDMLFFDDEGRNRVVESLGVTFCLVPDGLNRASFEEGIRKWQKNRK